MEAKNSQGDLRQIQTEKHISRYPLNFWPCPGLPGQLAEENNEFD